MHEIIADELRLLEEARAALARDTGPAAPSERDIVKELEQVREQLLEGRGETDRAALMWEWNRQSALLKQLRSARETTPVEARSPYFGHLRLRENGREWDLCLGKGTFIAGDVSIVDWRNAPISRVFYRYQQGDAFEEEIAGRTRTGVVVARRTVTIREGRLEQIDAPEGRFRIDPSAEGGWVRIDREASRFAGGEGAALQVYQQQSARGRRLGTTARGTPMRADKHLPDIAGLIDPEQFALITQPSSGLVVIRGTAGSGKTTVALHRIAYLAYDDPAIDSDRTLVLVFSRALRDYVAYVLPALGINHVHVRTFQEWTTALRRKLFPALPAETRDDAPAVVQRLKQHPAILTALAQQVERNPGPRNARQAIDDWGSVLSQRAVLAEAFGGGGASGFSDDELTRASDWSRRQHEEIAAFLAGDSSAQAALAPEDEALLLRAWQGRVGPIPDTRGRALRLRHVVVDEVQDFSPLEIRILLDCLDDHRSMTLAGDTQQQVMPDSGFGSWTEFFNHVGITGTEVNTLRVSYRSTHEIVDFALAILGDLREDDTPPMTTRSGPPVELFRFTDHGAAVAFLADALRQLTTDEPLASVALLTPSAELSGLYFRALQDAEVPRLDWVRDQRFTFTAGIQITEMREVKGLEFDYVVLIETSAAAFPDTPAARRLLHVGATRAIHQLWLTTVATPSPLLKAFSSP